MKPAVDGLNISKHFDLVCQLHSQHPDWINGMVRIVSSVEKLASSGWVSGAIKDQVPYLVTVKPTKDPFKNHLPLQ